MKTKLVLLFVICALLMVSMTSSAITDPIQVNLKANQFAVVLCTPPAGRLVVTVINPREIEIVCRPYIISTTNAVPIQIRTR